MARRGKFGRLPRSAPSLTSTIVSIAAAFQAQRDNNIVDAWKNGGMFEGAPATDERMLEYWRKRLDGISPKDPLYDQYKNTVFQFEYAIAQSKNELAYARGEINDMQRAQFFLDWAKKVPQDSELWRTLQKNAAQFIQRTKAQARAGASRAADNSLATSNQATYDEYVAAGDLMTKMVTQFARDKNFIGTNEDLEDLIFRRGNGPAGMIDLINQMNAERPSWVERLRQLDPTLTGAVTYEWYQQAIARQKTGLTLIRTATAAAGKSTKSIDDEIENLDKTARGSAMWDTAQAYAEARKTWLMTWEDPAATPTDKMKAWDAYRKKLVSLGSDPNNPVTPEIQTTLFAEAGYDPATRTFDLPDVTIDTWWENSTRATNVEASASGGKPSGDNAETATWLTAFAQDTLDVVNGLKVWTFGTRDKNGNFTPSSDGRDVGAVDYATAVSVGAQPVPIRQADGSFLVVYAPPKPVTTTVFDADGNIAPIYKQGVNGEPVNTSSVIGQVFDVWQNGQLVRIYSFTASDGTTRYSTEPPWKGTLTTDAKGNLTVVVQEAIDPNTGKSNIAWVEKTTSRTTGEKITVGYDPSATARDNVRDSAGINHQTDSLSPFVAAMLDMPIEDRERIANDPYLRNQIVGAFWEAIANEPDQAKRAAIFRLFLDQLDGATRPNVAGMGGIVSPYDNSNNRGAFADVTVPVEPSGQPQPGKVGDFTPLAKTMVVPGRFGAVDVRFDPSIREDRQGVQIIKPRSLTVPEAPVIQLFGPWSTPAGPAPVAPPPMGPAPGAYVPMPTPDLPVDENAAAAAAVRETSGTPYQTQGLTAEDLATPGATTYTPGGRTGF